MREIWNQTLYMWELYGAQGWYLYYYLMGIVFLLFVKRKEGAGKFFTGYSVIILVVFWLPFTAKLIMDFGIGRNVYWRMFWLMPIPLIIAWMGTELTCLFKKKWLKPVILAGMLVLTSVGGTWVYQEHVFQKEANIYKIPQTVIPLCQEMIDYSAGKEIKAAVADELLPYIRQYEPGIHMAYGRNATKDYQTESMEDAVLYGVLHAKNQDIETFLAAVELAGCNFIVLNGEHQAKQWADKEYQMLLEVDNYYLYYTE